MPDSSEEARDSSFKKSPLNLPDRDKDDEGLENEVFFLASDEISKFQSFLLDSEYDIFYTAEECFSQEKVCVDPSASAQIKDILLHNSPCGDREPLVTSEKACEKPSADGTDESEEDVCSESFGEVEMMEVEVMDDVEMMDVEVNDDVEMMDDEMIDVGDQIPPCLSPASENFLGNLEIVQELGRGSFGSVFLLKHKTQSTFLVDKICDVRFAEGAVKEYEVMKIAEGNRYFLNTIGHLPDPAGEYYHLFMEFFPSTDLHNFLDINILSFSEVQYVLRQIAQGLGFLHYKNIMHRDLKPANILIDEQMNCKLIDFGGCALGPTARGCFGTEHFCSPEVMAHQGEGVKFAPSYGFAVDCYSLGMTALYVGANLGAIKFLKEIFDSKMEVYDIEGMAVLKKLNPDGPEDSFHDLIYNLISEDPAERLSVNSVLSHEFFNKIFKGKRTELTPQAIERFKKKNKSISKLWKKKKEKETKIKENFEARIKQNPSATTIVHTRIISATHLINSQKIEKKKKNFWKNLKNVFKKPKLNPENNVSGKENKDRKPKNENSISSVNSIEERFCATPSKKKIDYCGFFRLFKKKKTN